MKSNIYIHGVPNGQDIWGCEQDRDYIKSFYGDNTDTSRFVVEVIPAKRRSFYTYLRGKNLSASDSRQGSYFGITISLDGIHCTNTNNLFQLCDMIFNRMIAGNILLNRNGTFCYACRNFEQKNKELEGIQSALQKGLAKFEDFHYLEPIDNTFKRTSEKIPKFNTVDVDSPWFFAVLKKTLRVHISPNYASQEDIIAALHAQINPEKIRNKKLVEANADLTRQLDDATRQNSSYAAELSKLRDENQKLNQLSAEFEKLKGELNNYRTKSSIENIVEQIRQPLATLCELFRELFPTTGEGVSGHTRKATKCTNLLRDILHVLTFVVVVGMAIFGYFQFRDYKTQKANEAAEIAIAKAKPSPQIVIEGINVGDSLLVGETYKVEIKDAPNGANLKWKLDGATTDDNRLFSAIKIAVGETNYCYITCCIGSEECRISLPVK